MKERHVGRRAVVPSLAAIVAIISLGLAVGGMGQASADGGGLFDGERYTLAPPPETWEIPATVTAATVFGEDDRVQVEDTTEWPYRIIAHLVVFDEFGEASHQCSGILLNYDVVLTAAHCVWDDYSDEPFGSIIVVPGDDGFLPFPFGAGGANGLSISIPRGYRETDEPEFDFGLVHLEVRDFGAEIGPFAILSTATDDFFNHPETILLSSGYPGDKPFGTQWSVGAYVDHVEPTLIYALMDSFGGQSGAPMFGVNLISEESAVVGVFTSASATMGRGLRLSDLHIDALHNYCEDAGCSFSSTHLDAPIPAPTPTNTPTPTPTPTKTPASSPTVSPTSPPGPSQLPFKSRVTYVGRD